MKWWPPNLRDEAKIEGYLYFDKHIRKLPKNPDGSINEFAPEFADNNVDAFRRTYVSDIFTQDLTKSLNLNPKVNILSLY